MTNFKRIGAFYMIENCELHHVGYVVDDIESTAGQFARLGYQVGEVLFDKGLTVELCYLTKKNSVTIELVHQLQADSLEAQLWQANGVMPYHLGFETADLDEACREMERLGYRSLFAPVPVEALGGQRICYFHQANVGYVELLERQA